MGGSSAGGGSDDTVDVVVPTLGRWALLPATLDAIEAQVDVSVRVIVVDDSPVPSSSWLQERATVVRTGGVGEGAARAAGLAATRSRWVAFCDDDDRWHPDKLRRQLAALGGEPGWCLTGVERVDGDDRRLGHWGLERAEALVVEGGLLRRLLTHNPIPAGPSSLVVDAELLRSVGGWDPEFSYFADWECFIRLATVCDPVFVPDELVRYRVWDGQMIGDRRPGWTALDQLRREHAGLRSAHGVGPLDDRVIAWILRGELHHRGRRARAVLEAARRLRPRRPSDLLAVPRLVAERLASRP